MHRRFGKSIFWLLPLVMTTAALAQESRGTISGRITDPSGASVPGASVVAANVETNVALRTTSNETGSYQIPFVVPGNYKLMVEAAGFKKLERAGIRVSTASEVAVDVKLNDAATTESMTVTAASPLLDTAGG